MKNNFNTTYTFAKIYNEKYDTFSFGNIFFTKMLIPEGGVSLKYSFSLYIF